ncbi:histidine kinase [Malaciobacter canalis]|uniref:histidine kinase n=1 Tax=Malaciobacter canalis TaxID=1912871 RepID=A0ABX4LM24_9BACT|nr:HAMP domain-containing sensor histidine kinase [Malaciobacter canalis]PHO08902.1 histidine kinase [Malaciobacter canalis]QEE34018.1 two-component system sensor histidine kinase [Malaciobacter canalis]
MRQTKLDEFIELEEQNRELEEKIQKEIEKNRQKEQILFHQSKLASMGEMLSSISHQWRQPLMEINSLFLPIEIKLRGNKSIDNDEVLEAISKLNEITKYMSNTINDFKNFFSTNKESIKFSLSTQINSAINILSTSLKDNNINLEIIVKKNPEVYGVKSEYSQVLINIINNAKEMLIYRKIKNPLIKITIDKKEDIAIIKIEDNAGGIKLKNIDDVFKPFYTNEKKDGSGIGLFMSKLIIEKNMAGMLSAENTSNGALFTIQTPQNIKK